MGAIDGRTYLEILSPPECRRLLLEGELGRVAFIVEGRPEILPVNYASDGEQVVFRTARGTKLSAVLDWPKVAFEIDGTSEEHDGWSVLVVGQAETISESEAVGIPGGADLLPWGEGEKPHWIRIRPEKVTGRRLVRVRRRLAG